MKEGEAGNSESVWGPNYEIKTPCFPGGCLIFWKVGQAVVHAS
jgi:hypothetical protein